MRQRLSAQSAQCQYHQLAAVNAAMRFFKFGHRRGGERLQRGLCQMGVAARDVACVASALNQLHAKRKAFFADIIAGNVEHGLIIGIANPARHRVVQRGHVAGQMHRARVNQRVQITALSAKIVGQRRRVAQNVGDQMQQPGPRLQQAEDVDGTGYRLDHIFEPRDGTVRIGGQRQCFHDRGQDGFKCVTRRCAADRANLAAAPPGHALHDGGGVGIAQIGQLFFKRQAFVGHARPFAAACVHHPVINRRDLRGDRADRINQRVGVRQPMQARDGIGGFAVLRYLVRLPVAVHLQTMFKCPQLFIGGGQRLRLLRANRASRRQPRQRLACVGHAQHRIASAMDQLMRLREKFTFADPAMATLQVEPKAHFLTLGIMVPNLRGHCGDVFQLPEIERLAPDKRLDSVQEICPQRAVACTDPRPDERRLLPRQRA